MADVKKSRAWGIGAFTAYGIFVVFVLGMVLFASMQRSDLVEDNPYEKGLAYQSRVDNIQNTAQSDNSVVVEYRASDGVMVVRFPNVELQQVVLGEIRLLRPSNAALDRRWPVRPDAAGVQEIPTAGLTPGMWRIEVDWKVDSVGYYYQTRMMLP